MRCVKMEGNCGVRVVDAAEPAAGPGEVVIETAVSAICGSEMGSYRGQGSKSGGNGGHEAAGVVAKLGEGVTNLKVGDRVGVSAIAGCGSCGYCANGQYTWCAARKFYGNMHAERFTASARACHLLPADVSWETGVLISGDGMGVPYHTNSRVPLEEVGMVAIFGAGPIGLGSVLLQSFLGRKVIAVDMSAPRLELAKELGAAHALNAGEGNAVDRIRELTGAAGADLCIEAAGRPETLKQCFAAARPGGAVALNGEQPAVELSPSNDFIRRDITAFGSWYYHFSEFAGMRELCRKGLRAADLITHRYPLEKAGEGFAEFAAGRTGKVILQR